jgi:hypothetical protein
MNRERRALEREIEREVGGHGVCGCSFGELLKGVPYTTGR